ncbi:hypothetical protein J7U46_20955 [Pelomonas sp. V22]|uniref:hypothetical protein n=1 Tax=Pelomonas sp. V22 TaxID=2822139 RepID=UPI0024A80941|nr:hypothetical protein [Pelomonas sp. V22]MDI4635546.1 hypothetical protein [Pelomonas sp. V22]
MLLNLNDPDSIVGWWLTFPERHDAYLEYVARHSPQFGPAIRQARQQLRADPHCRALLEQAAEMARRAPQVQSEPEDEDDAVDLPVSAYLEMAH